MEEVCVRDIQVYRMDAWFGEKVLLKLFSREEEDGARKVQCICAGVDANERPRPSKSSSTVVHT